MLIYFCRISKKAFRNWKLGALCSIPPSHGKKLELKRKEKEERDYFGVGFCCLFFLSACMLKVSPLTYGGKGGLATIYSVILVNRQLWRYKGLKICGLEGHVKVSIRAERRLQKQ